MNTDLDVKVNHYCHESLYLGMSVINFFKFINEITSLRPEWKCPIYTENLICCFFQSIAKVLSDFTETFRPLAHMVSVIGIVLVTLVNSYNNKMGLHMCLCWGMDS